MLTLACLCLKSHTCGLTLVCLQAIQHECAAVHRSDAAEDDQPGRHEKLSRRQGLSELLHDWVADMRAAGLKHNGPSVTALVQVMLMLMYVTPALHIDKIGQV